MKSDDWVVSIDPSNRQAIEAREIYGYAGLALSVAQILEHNVKNFIVLGKAIETKPEDIEKLERFRVELEKFEVETFRKTLGPLIESIKKRFHFAAKPSLTADLERSLTDRNQLVHHFFWDRAVQLVRSSEERQKMAEELKRIHAQLKRTIEDFAEATKALRDAVGITEELVTEVVQASLAGASDTEIKELIRKKRGSALPP